VIYPKPFLYAVTLTNWMHQNKAR